jgi:hypothetical protein
MHAISISIFLFFYFLFLYIFFLFLGLGPAQPMWAGLGWTSQPSPVTGPSQ